MAENVTEVTEAKPLVTTPPVTAPITAPVTSETIVPEVTAHPRWALAEEDWHTFTGRFAKIEEKFGGLDGVLQILSPLVDALKEEAESEIAPTKKKHFMNRPLWGSRKVQ